jgi:hypothetical protein
MQLLEVRTIRILAIHAKKLMTIETTTMVVTEKANTNSKKALSF